MSWLEPKHECAMPSATPADNPVASRWECDECGTRWHIARWSWMDVPNGYLACEHGGFLWSRHRQRVSVKREPWARWEREPTDG